MDQTVGQALETLQSQLSRILGIGFSLYLYGSVPLGDFRPGWSDIDLLCVAPGELSEKQAEGLLNLRQIMQRRYPGNPQLRSFEGMIVPPDALSGRNALCVYWGASGQRLVTTFSPDVFMRYELKSGSVLLCGEERLFGLAMPDYRELREGVRTHLECIRKYAVRTSGNLYACGWLLDIARCIYTLRTGRVIAKTAAGEWALGEHLCQDENALMQTLAVRREPLRYKNDPAFTEWACGLGDSVQAFADRLEEELFRTEDCVLPPRQV